MTKQVVRYTVVLFVGLLLAAILALPFPLASGQSAPGADEISLSFNPEEPPTKAYPNLDSSLAQLVVDGRTSGISHARALAEDLGFTVQDEASVRVIIESEAVATSETVAAAEALGAVVETTYQNLIQARVPLAALEALSQTSGVKFVERPISPVLDAIVSEGIEVIGVGAWQTAGFGGIGIKVAILDVEFQGFETLLGTELPATVITHWSPSLGQGSGSHGTACAEVVHDVAPGSELYLVTAGTPVELGNAVDWLIAQGVRVISHSVSWFNVGPGDGTGFVDSIVVNAESHGILWVSSAGNYARNHWSGQWEDTEGDRWYNFSSEDEGNSIYATAGDTIQAFLRWTDHPGNFLDYDLYLFRSGGVTPVAYSVNLQSGSQAAMEEISYPVTATGTFFFAILRSTTNIVSGSSDFDLFVPGYVPEYQVASRSITNPGDSPSALTVGAVAWNNPDVIEPYSSQGPTKARGKPDLVGPARVSTVSYGSNTSNGVGFAGTSAATPHIAGAAALVMSAYPSNSLAQTRYFLQAQAVDLGAWGKDNIFGNGRLQLGSAYNAPVTDFHASATSVQAGTAITFTDDTPSVYTPGPNRWSWDFDNNGSTDDIVQNPTHTYTVPGSYSVQLTTTNSVGWNTATKLNYITVTAGPLHHIVVDPSNTSVQVGGSQTFTAEGYDQFNNLRIGDVFTWGVTNALAGSIDRTTGVFTAGTLAANWGNAIHVFSGTIGTTAWVTVTPGSLHHVTVIPAGCTLQAGASQTFVANGYDQFNNPRSGDTYIWSVTDPAAGTIVPSTGVFTAGGTLGSYGNAIQAASGTINGTTSVTVTAGPLHHIVVAPSAASVPAGNSRTFVATGYDQYNNLRSGDNLSWSVVNPVAGSINASTGAFTAGGTPGVYTDVISVTSGTVTATASVTVTVGPLHHITVSPANPSVVVNGNQTFTAAGFDQFENAVTGLTFSWSVTSAGAGSINASTGVFTAGTLARTFNNSVQATSGAVIGTTSVTVTSGSLHHIAVVPGNPYVPVNGSQTYAATGYDQYSNAISGLTFAWSLTNPAAGAIDPSTGVLTAGGSSGTFADVVQAASGEVTGTASVRVFDGNVLNGSVTLQGGSRTPSARVVSVTVKLFPTETNNTDLNSGAGVLATFSADTEDMGTSTVFFQVTDLDLVPGTYDITVSSSHTLMNVKRNAVIGAGATSINFGTLLEGNSNNDSIVNALDFSIMASSYMKSSGQTGYDNRSDYDCSGMVNAIDFSLMANNYMKTSPLAVS